MTLRRAVNKRETGKRIAKPVRPDDPSHEFSQDAAENRKPAGRFGLSEPVDQTQARTRKSEGVEPGIQSAPRNRKS
jgi:hypothetical protein